MQKSLIDRIDNLEKTVASPATRNVDDPHLLYSTMVKAVLNSSIYAFMLICFHLIAPAVTTDFGLFLCTTFIWGFSHAAGGVILVAFNPEIRRHLPCCTYRTTKPIETCLSVTVRTQRR
ncbi:hypothetical protein Q1695_012185 [Nippostrongylus brasiliensis]|nr:hypothetical protein Q1695_012185 [Nippostrongylus brasiliensis]